MDGTSDFGESIKQFEKEKKKIEENGDAVHIRFGKARRKAFFRFLISVLCSGNNLVKCFRAHLATFLSFFRQETRHKRYDVLGCDFDR